MKVLCFALFACAFNLLIGYVGLLSFGHAMFFGFAAYVAGHARQGHWALGRLEAGAIARRATGRWCRPARPGRGASPSAARASTSPWSPWPWRRWCSSSACRRNSPAARTASRPSRAASCSASSTVATTHDVLCRAGDLPAPASCIIYRIIHSPFGQVLKAIRENEPRAISLGYAVDRYKLMAFVLSAALAGLAGATKALVFQLASLTDVHWQMSGEVVLMTLVGGMGTVFGPIVGAAIIVYMQNYLAGFGEWVIGDPGRDLRRLRARVPARHRRRAGRPPAAARRHAGEPQETVGLAKPAR